MVALNLRRDCGYLSDLEPVKIVELLNFDQIFHYDMSMSLCQSWVDCHGYKFIYLKGWSSVMVLFG